MLQEYDTLDSSNSGGKTSFDSAGSRHVPEKRSRKLSRPKSLTNLVWDLRGTLLWSLVKQLLDEKIFRWRRWGSNAAEFEQTEPADAPRDDGARAWGEGGEGYEGGKGWDGARAEGEQQQDGNPLPLACCR